MVLLVKYLLGKYENLSLIPQNPHFKKEKKSQAWWHRLRSLALEG